ncbi:hypothetical protein [Streptomyces sp. NBC_00091]|uniref:hypothetical protein n=1 Tax=Streptomyces sp. NBC_00091 TaxID=2975648 RepID=UPI0022529918|nr:hypothetical protein [Streptomyces sp. NBC_00091]MCX5380383.1 hypothetical protein [Streptomyces sp. NBC_00091]
MTPITSLDLTGFTEREPGVWTDERGLVLSVHFFGLAPDLPAPLSEPDRLRHGLARSVASAGAGLIEAVVGEVDTVPAVRQLVKVPRPGGHGQVFLGSWTMPRAGCSAVVKVQAAEGSMTGIREAVILARTGPERYFAPHPYGPGVEGGLPYHVADREEWDAEFPDHPLTLVRAALRRVTPTVILHDAFKALPPFGGAMPTPMPPSPAAGPSGVRRWFRRG